MRTAIKDAPNSGSSRKPSRLVEILLRLTFAPFGLLFTGLSLFLAYGVARLVFNVNFGVPHGVNTWGWALTALAVIGIFGFVGVRMLIGVLGRGDAWMPVTTQVLLATIFLGCGLGYLEVPQEMPRRLDDSEVVMNDRSLIMFVCTSVMVYSIIACLRRRRHHSQGGVTRTESDAQQEVAPAKSPGRT